MHKKHLRIAWFSDLSIGTPRSVSAYCSHELLPLLSQEHSIELFSDSFSSSELGLPHWHYLKAYKRHELEPFDIFFYQLEDGRAFRSVRGHIGLIPGVVWVHDLFCKDLGPEACHTSPWENTVRQFFDQTRSFMDRSVAPHQLWPRVYRETSLSPVVLFSSRWARDEFTRMTSNRLEACEGGHVAELLPVPVSANPGRTQQTSRNSEVVSVACASVTGIEGRAHKLLPALRGLPFPWRLRWMVDAEELPTAEALVREFGIEADKVEFVVPRSPDAWVTLVQKSDLALHLHTSTFGHLSPYLQLTLAEGCPAVVARSAQGEDFPSDVVFQIVPGVHEATELQVVLHAVQTRGRGELGAEGSRYIHSCASTEVVARHLAERLRVWAPEVAQVMQRWDALRLRAQAELLQEVRALVADGSHATPDPFEAVLHPAIRELGWE
jgi:hypothetical protein